MVNCPTELVMSEDNRKQLHPSHLNYINSLVKIKK